MLRRFLLLITALGACVAVVTGISAYWVAHQPLRLAADRVFFIAEGEALSSVSRRLAELSGRPYFHIRLIAAVRGISDQLQKGEYLLRPTSSIDENLLKFVRGDRVQRQLTIVEGLSNRELVAALNTAEGLVFDGLKTDERPRLPETYAYEWGDKAGDLYERMAQEFDRLLDQLWVNRAPGLAITTKQQAIVLASIIEKETGVGAERAKISAVFHNRLRKNMRLQSDPTVIFALTNGLPLGRALTRTDLRTDSPYNTYRVRGLPPKPIANPGRAALEAALNPADVPFLYFVATGTGGHNFAVTLADHNKNVRAYRRAIK